MNVDDYKVWSKQYVINEGLIKILGDLVDFIRKQDDRIKELEKK